MQATRSRIVEHLKQRGQATIQDLTAATGLTSMTVRHHLAVLEADGLVSSAKERGHVGRPRHVYFLTENALSLFPERYDELAHRLLEGLKALGARREVTRVLEKMGANIARIHRGDLAGKSFEERLDLLISVLSDEGFLASWAEEAGKYTLTEYSCPYLLVGQDHPEVCQVDWQVITRILDAPVKKETCMLQGDTNCTFHIRPEFDVAIADISAG
ncbi:MAG: helix-turn-helix transcriptional regulator [Anaerolineae bacterium]